MFTFCLHASVIYPNPNSFLNTQHEGKTSLTIKDSRSRLYKELTERIKDGVSNNNNIYNDTLADQQNVVDPATLQALC